MIELLVVTAGLLVSANYCLCQVVGAIEDLKRAIEKRGGR